MHESLQRAATDGARSDLAQRILRGLHKGPSLGGGKVMPLPALGRVAKIDKKRMLDRKDRASEACLALVATGTISAMTMPLRFPADDLFEPSPAGGENATQVLALRPDGVDHLKAEDEPPAAEDMRDDPDWIHRSTAFEALTVGAQQVHVTLGRRLWELTGASAGFGLGYRVLNFAVEMDVHPYIVNSEPPQPVEVATSCTRVFGDFFGDAVPRPLPVGSADARGAACVRFDPDASFGPVAERHRMGGPPAKKQQATFIAPPPGARVMTSPRRVSTLPAHGSQSDAPVVVAFYYKPIIDCFRSARRLP